MIHGSLWSKEVREYRLLFLLCFLCGMLGGIVIPLYHDTAVNLPGGFVLWSDLTLSSFQDNTWIPWTSAALLQLSAITAVLFGFSALSGETSRSTAGFLLSKPVSRREIVTTKIIAGLTLLAFYVYGISLLFLGVFWGTGHTLEFGEFILSCTVTFIVISIIYTGTAVFSALFKRSWLSLIFSALFWLAVFSIGFYDVTRNYSVFNIMKEAGFWSVQNKAFIIIGLGIVIAGLLYELAFQLWAKREY